MNRLLPIAFLALTITLFITITDHNSTKKDLAEEVELRELLIEKLNEANNQIADMEDGLKAYQSQVEILESQLTRTEKELAELEKVFQEKSKEIKELKSEQQSVSRGSNPGGQVVQTFTGFELTWYNYNSGKTSTGVPPVKGTTVAVDPRIIPYGSKIRITLPNGEVLYRVAQDTGSAVKSKNGGKIVDVYSTASTEELFRRGRTRNVKVEILN